MWGKDRQTGEVEGDKHRPCRGWGSQQERPAQSSLFQTAAVTVEWTTWPCFQGVQRMSQVPETVNPQYTKGSLTSQGLQQQTVPCVLLKG